MPEPVIALLIGASLASLIVYLYWADRQHPDRRRRKAYEAEVYCAWCVYRYRDVAFTLEAQSTKASVGRCVSEQSTVDAETRPRNSNHLGLLTGFTQTIA